MYVCIYVCRTAGLINDWRGIDKKRGEIAACLSFMLNVDGVNPRRACARVTVVVLFIERSLWWETFVYKCTFFLNQCMALYSNVQVPPSKVKITDDILFAETQTFT